MLRLFPSGQQALHPAGMVASGPGAGPPESFPCRAPCLEICPGLSAQRALETGPNWYMLV